jgi:hypothetical protein
LKERTGTRTRAQKEHQRENNNERPGNGEPNEIKPHENKELKENIENKEGKEHGVEQ